MDASDLMFKLRSVNATINDAAEALKDFWITNVAQEREIAALQAEVAALGTQVDEAVAGAYAACAVKAREIASHYDQSTDGRNTFIIMADWCDAQPPADAQAALARRDAETIKRIAETVRGWRNDVPMTGEECANAILAMIEEPRHG